MVRTIRQSILFCTVAFTLWTPVTFADYSLNVGPAATGGGGSNPISVPPTNPGEYEFVYYNPSTKKEWIYSIVPGFFYAHRGDLTNNIHSSLGVGLVINRSGVGFGIYGGFGYTFDCEKYCFGFEYKQAIGLIKGMTINPYSLRIAMTYKTK